jgi:hypothetical protein
MRWGGGVVGDSIRTAVGAERVISRRGGAIARGVE